MALRPPSGLPSWREELATGRHAVSYLRELVRGNRVAQKEFYRQACHAQPPVLLLHGFLGTRGSLFPLERRLRGDGIGAVSFRLGRLNAGDIRSSALLVQRKIDALLERTQLEKVDIVGYSMGGLIGLYYVKKLGGFERVRKLIMMGTPQEGTWAALPAVAMVGLVSPGAWQMLPGSRFLDELRRGPLPPSVEYYTFAAKRDWTCPLERTRLDGATHVEVPLGHPSLVMSDEIYERLLWALRR